MLCPGPIPSTTNINAVEFIPAALLDTKGPTRCFRDSSPYSLGPGVSSRCRETPSGSRWNVSSAATGMWTSRKASSLALWSRVRTSLFR